MKKICCKCKEEKSVDMFYKNRTKKDGFQEECKHCNDIRVREYVDKNRDKVNKRRRDFWKNNPERYKKHLQKGRLYTENNREKERERTRKYYKKNKDKELNRGKKNRDELADNYIVRCMLQKNKTLKSEDIPQWLIEAKRQEIKLKRILIKGDKDERQKTSK
tara:strand:+ start:219 stop:704 length:486 start_codon:yes stop_codon:yes gene_type:complete